MEMTFWLPLMTVAIALILVIRKKKKEIILSAWFVKRNE